ncbi:MAG: hypothetical protein Q9228_003628 [Teloschistes exilis]
MDAFTPQQTAELVSRIGAKKSHMRLDKLWWNSFMTGPLIGFGILIELLLQLRRSFEYRDSSYGGIFELAAYRQQTINFATLKAVDPRWHQIFLRGIGANWLVCFAVFISISSREIVSKIIAIWWPTVRPHPPSHYTDSALKCHSKCTFVALGLDHVVANMFFIPISIWNSHPDISVPFYIYKSLIPTLLGNIVGGGVFVGAIYWYLYLMGTGAVEVDFNTSGGLGNAAEGRTQVIDVVKQQQEGGVSSGEMLNPQQLPHSGSGMRSGVAEELDAKLYATSKAGRTDEEKAAAQI